MATGNRLCFPADSSNTRHARSRLESTALILALFLVCFVVFFHYLGQAALFEPDEGRNAEVAREILLTQDWVTPHYDFIPRLDKPIFYYWLVASSYKLFGVSELSARLPSAIAALACLALTVALALTMAGFTAALWSGLILATGVEFFLLSQIAILDMTLALFITLSLCAFRWGIASDRGKSKQFFYALMYASIGIAALIKGPIGIIIPGLVISLYLFQTKNWVLLKELNLFAGVPLLLLIAGSWYLWAEIRNPGAIRYFFLEENVLRFLTPQFDRTQPWYYFFLVVIVGFLPWTLLIAFVAEDLWKRPIDEATVFLTTWTLLPVFFFSFSDAKLPHYILPMYPPLAVLTAKSLCRTLREPSEKTNWAVSLPWVTIASALMLIMVALFRPDTLPGHLRNPIEQFAPMISVPVISMMVFIVLALALGAATVLWKKPDALYVSYCLGLVVVFLSVHVLVTAVSRSRSSKELAARAAPLIGPEDGVVLYNAYLSSLPFYLRVARPLWVVSSGAEKRILGSTYVAEKFGRSAAGRPEMLLTYEQFPEFWRKSRERLVVFARAKDVARLSRQGLVLGQPILQSGDVVLLANK